MGCGGPVGFLIFQTGEIPDYDLDETCGNPSMFHHIDDNRTNYSFQINSSKILQCKRMTVLPVNCSTEKIQQNHKDLLNYTNNQLKD